LNGGCNTKKLLLAFLGTAALLSLLFTAFAYFDDIEASIENSFEVGTWAVEGGGNHSYSNLTAGASGKDTWTATNTGSVSAYVDLNISVIEIGAGNLADFLIGYLYVSGGDDIYSGPVSGIRTGRHDLDLPLEPGESVDIILDWYVSDDYFPMPDGHDEARVIISFGIHPAP